MLFVAVQRHLPGRTSLLPRAATRALRVHRESVEFDPVLNEAVPRSYRNPEGASRSDCPLSVGDTTLGCVCRRLWLATLPNLASGGGLGCSI